MTLFKKAVKPDVLPPRAFTKEVLRGMWWGIFTGLIEYSIDDQSALERAGRNAVDVTSHARSLADAAIDQFEDRWAE